MYHNQNYQIPQQPQDPNQSPKKQGKGRKIAQKALSLSLIHILLVSSLSPLSPVMAMVFWHPLAKRSSESSRGKGAFFKNCFIGSSFMGSQADCHGFLMAKRNLQIAIAQAQLIQKSLFLAGVPQGQLLSLIHISLREPWLSALRPAAQTKQGTTVPATKMLRPVKRTAATRSSGWPLPATIWARCV